MLQNAKIAMQEYSFQKHFLCLTYIIVGNKKDNKIKMFHLHMQASVMKCIIQVNYIVKYIVMLF